MNHNNESQGGTGVVYIDSEQVCPLVRGGCPRDSILTPDLRITDTVKGPKSSTQYWTDWARNIFGTKSTGVVSTPLGGVVMETILVVDSPGTRQALRNLLLGAGFDVRFVVESATTRTVSCAAMPSAILLGLDRDDIPKLSTFLELRHMAPETAMIILSPNTDVRTKIRLLELGADDYIEEPFEPLELLARVRSFVRRRKLRA